MLKFMDQFSRDNAHLWKMPQNTCLVYQLAIEKPSRIVSVGNVQTATG